MSLSFRNKILAIRKRIVLNRKLEFFHGRNTEKLAGQECIVTTIAFNNPEVISFQIKLMRKYFTDKHVHFILDNSNVPERAKEIEQLCLENEIPYLGFCSPLYLNSGSLSHALALNWAYKQIIKRFKPHYFGFIDHDIYPVSAFSLTRQLANQTCYGHLQQRGKIWYLWAGFCFFVTNSLPEELDFSPGNLNGVNVDTGGQLLKGYYERFNPDKLNFPSHKYGQLRDGKIAQSDQYEQIGDWIHTFNGSYWMAVEKKESLIWQVLQPYL